MGWKNVVLAILLVWMAALLLTADFTGVDIMDTLKAHNPLAE